MRFIVLFFLLFLSLISFQVYAVPLPDAGQILQEQKQIPKLPNQLPKATKEATTPLPEKKGELKIAISAFQFSGFEGTVTEAELQNVVRPYLGKKLSLTQLKNITKQITNYLRNKGYFLARAYLPAQEIDDGVVHIVISVGQVEGVPELRLAKGSRIKKKVLTNMARHGAPSGEGLNKQHLERTLLLMNDLPGISANAILEKGKKPGTTHVIIKAQEGPLFNGVFSINNFGNRFTGATQDIVQVAANDLSGRGDQLSANMTIAEGLQQGTLGYNLPLGSSGLKGNISYTGLHYALGKEFKYLHAEGTADTFTAKLNYPIYRSRRGSLWQGLGYEYRDLEDKTASITTSERKLHVASAITTGNYYDNFAGGGLTNLFVLINSGNLDYGLANQEIIDKATAGSAGRYTKLAYSISRLQKLTNSVTFFADFSGQFASNNLDSSEKFILGGPAGVRAYPVGEGVGDEGYRLTTEVRYDLPHKIISGNLQIIAFFDTGHIKLHNSPWLNSVITSTGRNSYNLSGAGLGVNWDKSGQYALRASYAHTLGSNPGQSVSGKNADNKNDNQQFWLQAIIWF